VFSAAVTAVGAHKIDHGAKPVARSRLGGRVIADPDRMTDDRIGQDLSGEGHRGFLPFSASARR
jgi:hypothetical protein